MFIGIRGRSNLTRQLAGPKAQPPDLNPRPLPGSTWLSYHCTSSCTRVARTTAVNVKQTEPHPTTAAPLNSSSSTSSSSSVSAVSDQVSPRDQFDVVVIGAGIGGLSCAAMLAYYGFKVLVCESHSVAGGAAHCWSTRGCHFDSGTALFFGLPAAQTAAGLATATTAAAGNAALVSAPTAAAASCSDNPLSAVLTLLGEDIDVINYGHDRTCLVFPQGTFRAQIGSDLFPDVVGQLWGHQAQHEWMQLQQLCRDLASAAVALHPMVVRYDPAVAVTAALRRPLRFARYLTGKPKQLDDNVMFSDLVNSVVSCPELQSFLDVLSQGTSGAPAADIPAAYMVRAFAEMYQPGTVLQWPRGGPQAIADALIRGLRRHGGKLLLNCHVTGVMPGPGGEAAGVLLKNGRRIAASKAVVSNASVWDTQRLVPQESLLPSFKQQVLESTPSDSFIHLHAIVDLPNHMDPQQLPVHSYFLAPELVGATGWPTLTISTAVDDSLAPPGKQVLHAYMADSFSSWQDMKRGSSEYKALKEAKAELLWGLVEQVVPGARSWLDWQTIGTPLTHRYFRRRHHGAYGASRGSNSSALASMQPQAVQAMKGLYCCGDCTFPYVGTPAVAASGMWVANTLAPVGLHWKALNVVDP